MCELLPSQMFQTLRYSLCPHDVTVSQWPASAAEALYPRGASDCPAASAAFGRDARHWRSSDPPAGLYLLFSRLCARWRSCVVVTGERARAYVSWTHHVVVCLSGSVFRRHRSVQQHELPRTDQTSGVHVQRGYTPDQPARGDPQTPQSSTQSEQTLIN